MKSLLSIFALLLAFCASAQYPPPYVHNYWDTNADPRDAFNLTNLNASQLAVGIIPSPRYTGAGVNSVKLGSAAAAGGNSISIGSLADSSGSNSIAIGFGALGQVKSTTALGDAANASHSNSTAIGQNSSTTRPNQVMLGAVGGETRAAGILVADGVITGDGSGLTNLPSSGGVSVAAGTNIVVTTNLSVLTLNVPGIQWGMTTTNTITNSLSKGTMLINIGGGVTATSFSGSGAALTTLTAANVTGTGTLPDSVLSANVPLLNANQTFSGVNTFGITTNTTSLDTARLNGNGTPPTVAVNTNALTGLNFGATATLNAGSTALAGTVTFTTGAGTQPATSTCFTNIFPATFSAAPTVLITMIGPVWASSGFLRSMTVNTVTTSLFTVQVGAGQLSAGTTYQISYMVIGK